MAVLAHALAALVLVDFSLTSLLKRSHNDLCVVCGFLDWENGRLPLWANGEICNYLLREKSSRKRILGRILSPFCHYLPLPGPETIQDTGKR